MLNRRLVLSACCLAFLTLATVSPNGAGAVDQKTMKVTFSHPFRLPGVGLPPGSYLFELPSPNSAWDVVQVLSGDRRQVYFMGYTRIIPRPDGLSRNQVVSLGESVSGAPMPVTVWYPDNESTGRQFIYPQGH